MSKTIICKDVKGQKHSIPEHEMKFKQIVDFFVRNAIDPQSGNPLTPERIKNALEQSHIQIKNASVESQVPEIFDKLSRILPIKIETKRIKVTIPAIHTGKAYSIISQYKKRVKKEVSPSLVYPFLQQLEEKGLVTHTLKPVGEKEKKVFELTKKGRELTTGLFKRFSELVSIAIEPSLFVCAHCGCKVYEGAYREVIDGTELTFCCTHCARSYKETKKLAAKAVEK